MAQGRLMQWKDADRHVWGNDPDELDFDAIEQALEGLRPFFGPHSWFETQVSGWERIPERTAMFVGNHSGGTTIPDTWGLGVAWYEHFGRTRPLHALAHEMVFVLEGLGKRFARLGILRANREMARRVLVDEGRDLMVYPGGDIDTWRPYADRYKVQFAGRTGYARIAIETGVPVVPVAQAGSHQSLVVLTDGRKLAEKLRLPQLFRAHIFPIHLSFPYGLAIGPFPHLPPPGTLRYRFGTPVVPPRWDGEGPVPRELIEDFDRACQAALQRELDVLRDEEEGLRERVRHLAERVRSGVSGIRAPMAAK